MHIEPQTARFEIDNTRDGLRAVIPATRNWFIMLFLLAWLGGWAFGELSAVRELLTASAKTPTAFLSFWLVGWTIGGAFALATVLWQVAGREVITVNSTTLSYRVEILGLGRTRSYRAAEVKGLRATDYSINPFTNQRAWFPPITGSGVGPVAFDYGARTIRVAPSLEEAEAKMLVRALAAKLPHTQHEI
jgi:hypothetical protein